MNAVFAVIFICSAIAITFLSPEALLMGLTSGAEKSLKLSFTLMVLYSVWLGIFNILERTNFTQKVAKWLYKPVNALFRGVSDKSSEYLTTNITANLLGLGSVATPMGIKAAAALDEEHNEFAKCMLFAVAATSIQLIPTTAITLRSQYGSVASADIFLPTLLSTTVSTVCAVLLTFIFVKK